MRWARNADGWAKGGAAKGGAPSQVGRQSRRRISAQPCGKANDGRIASLPLRSLASRQRRSRRLALPRAIRLRTPGFSVNRPQARRVSPLPSASRTHRIGDPMDATKLLTQQHRRLEAGLKEALQAQEPAARSAALTRAGDELTKHLTSEEEAFYPAVKARSTEDVLLESLEDHLSLKRLLGDLLAMDAP